MDRPRLTIQLSADLCAALERLTTKPTSATKSGIIEDALRAWLKRQGASELEERFSFRLDRMTKAIARTERDLHIVIETLGLFILYELTINAPLPEDDAASRAMGRARFEQFINRVGNRLASGKRFLDWEKLSAAPVVSEA